MAYIGNQPLATSVTNADISSSAAIDLSKLATSGDLSATNVTLGGYLRGPSTFTIDPAAHGDNTGTLVIAGNLQIDGTTTTVNSTTMTVDDKNITVASGAANAAAADGAGITVDGASATFTYANTGDKWTMNKPLDVSGDLGVISGTDAKLTINDSIGEVGSGNLAFQTQNAADSSLKPMGFRAEDIRFATGSAERMRIDSSGNVMVATTSTAPAVSNSETGIALGVTGYVAASRSGDSSGFFNRLASDGDIVTFNKDGSTVGSIGTAGGALYIGSTTGNDSYLAFYGDVIIPSTSVGLNRDNAIDLGYSNSRFKDLHLSGGVVDNTTTVSYASSIALSYTNGAIQTVTLTGNATFTDGLNDGEAIVLMLNGGASHTVTWTAVTKWVTGSGNAAPTLTASDAIILWKIGSSVYAATAGSFA